MTDEELVQVYGWALVDALEKLHERSKADAIRVMLDLRVADRPEAEALPCWMEWGETA